MDIFMEKIVSKKKDSKDLLFNIGIIVAGVLLFFIIPSIPVVNMFSLFLNIGIIFGIYFLITSRNIEFEYIVTNGDIDIDKIISKRKRKRVFSANCKDFDVVARIKSDKYDHEAKNIKNRLELVSSMDSPDVYFAALNYKGERTIVFFEPSEKMLNSFKIYIPRKIFID